MSRLFGLIGYPLSHSFSKRYFGNKFAAEGILDSQYELFPLNSISDFPALLQANPNFKGINVTIPYKQAVIPYLTQLSQGAEAVGAVNTISFEADGTLTGYNTDVTGFAESLKNHPHYAFLASMPYKKALVLGYGGAARAVLAGLSQLGFKATIVSRRPENDYPNCVLWDNLSPELILEHKLIINTTPLGMYPNIDTCPNIPWAGVTNEHLLFDLVYNPEQTTFLSKGLKAECHVLNGLEMLTLQAEAAWKIWNQG